MRGIQALKLLLPFLIIFLFFGLIWDSHTNRKIAKKIWIQKNMSLNPGLVPSHATISSTDAPKLQIPSWIGIQFERQERLRRFCSKQPQASLLKNFKDGKRRHNWIYSDKARVSYCSVPKVACTTWKKIFQVFYGNYKDPMDIKVNKDRVHDLHYQSFDKLNRAEAGLKTQMYYNFIITRHPFERVVSAYRNKLEKPFDQYFQRMYGSKILRMFRKNLTESEYKAGKGVTFFEFVDYIIRTPMENLDEHWRWMYGLCNICGVKYDYIADMKTLYEDSDNIIKAIGWNDKLKFPADSKDSYKTSAIDLTPSFMNKLTDKQLNDLYKAYKQDFDAFGYEYDLEKIRKGKL